MKADFGDERPEPDRQALIGVLARLHDATPLARRTAPARSLSPASRPALEAALGQLDRPWGGGPYSEPTRQLLARQAPGVARAPHEQNEDSGLTWEVLTETIGEIA